MKRRIAHPTSPYKDPSTDQQSGLIAKKWYVMPRKCIAKVVLSKEQKEILAELARRLGTSESETLRMALMDYAKELSLITERIHKMGNQSF